MVPSCPTTSGELPFKDPTTTTKTESSVGTSGPGVHITNAARRASTNRVTRGC